jgi:glycosyltransferase involved in cell wall biosynthesis
MLQQLARWYDVYFLSLGSATDAEAFERAFGACVTDYAFVPRHVGTGKTRLWKIYRTVTGRCDFLPAHDRGLRRLCRQEVFTHRFDAILLSSVLLRALPLPEDVPTIGDTHNAEFDVLRRTAMFADRFSMRQYARLQWRLMRREERRCGRKVDLVLATSARDRQLFEDELGLSDVALVPNGTDLDEFSPGAAPPVRDTILFSGLMSYYPNQQAIRWFVNTVLPLIRRRLPAARLVVAGASPPHWLKTCAGTHVEITGQVPDIRPYLERATVVVCAAPHRRRNACEDSRSARDGETGCQHVHRCRGSGSRRRRVDCARGSPGGICAARRRSALRSRAGDPFRDERARAREAAVRLERDRQRSEPDTGCEVRPVVS